MIPVTKPFLPPIEDYEGLIKGIWEREWLTNNGPLVREVEQKLNEYLETSYLAFVTNGTIALQLAIKALDLKGEIITTPFSYVATTSSIVWEGCTPVFVDIDPRSLNLDAGLIEKAITPATTAILATHVYGNPCDVDAIEAIAAKHCLRVIYDGAHAFGVKYKGKSIFEYGDISTASFHATKLFHTIEGGAVFTGDQSLMKRIEFMRNFGHNGPLNFAEVGINGKNSEVHAAMGVIILKYITQILSVRKRQFLYYENKLVGFPAEQQQIHPGTTYNYSYFPLIFNSEEILLKAEKALNDNDISPRRYFYPALNDLFYTKNSRMPTPHCKDISRRILCLPLYHTLTFEEIDKVCNVLFSVC